ncbi:aminotransferase class IV [Streptomyces sp. NPDC056716]|uniref:aminotransferase class IV n=1 Tax=unclassified Streptomyces TaxID=2593676 RepID=UPI0036B4E297
MSRWPTPTSRTSWSSLSPYGGAGTLPRPPLRAKSITCGRHSPEVKHTGLFGALLARATAQHLGFDDALFVGPDGFVAEGRTWNLALIDQQGTVVRPQASVLPGVAMALLPATLALPPSTP